MYPSVIAKQPRSHIMTYQTDCTLPESLLEQIAEQGLNILPELVRIVINTAMQAEREAYLGAVNLAIRPLILLAVMREGFIVSLIGPLR